MPTVYAALLNADDLSVQWSTQLDQVRDGTFTEDETATSNPEEWTWWEPAAVISAGARALYIVHADEDRLTTVDFAARTVRSVTIQPKQSVLDQLMALTADTAHAKAMNGTTKRAALSPDGKRLYVVRMTTRQSHGADGEWTVTETPLGLQVIDPTTGAETARLDTAARDIHLAPDGSRLYLRGLSC
jgi:hypothetical protein